MDYLLGIDVGSTSMKALVYDLDGNVISRGSHPTESIANDPDHPNWQVYLPDHIWDGIASAIRDAVSQIGPQNRITAATVTKFPPESPWLQPSGGRAAARSAEQWSAFGASARSVVRTAPRWAPKRKTQGNGSERLVCKAGDKPGEAPVSQLVRAGWFSRTPGIDAWGVVKAGKQPNL